MLFSCWYYIIIIAIGRILTGDSEPFFVKNMKKLSLTDMTSNYSIT